MNIFFLTFFREKKVNKNSPKNDFFFVNFLKSMYDVDENKKKKRPPYYWVFWGVFQ